jgi:hypothetical protein
LKEATLPEPILDYLDDHLSSIAAHGIRNSFLSKLRRRMAGRDLAQFLLHPDRDLNLNHKLRYPQF